MKKLLKFYCLLAHLCLEGIVLAQKINRSLVCYYDSDSSLRPGLAKLSQYDLETALEYCSHLVYGYAGLTANSYTIASLNVDKDVFYYRQITALKMKFPHLKVFLSLGGDKDHDEADTNKYMHFLEGGKPAYKNFIESSQSLLKEFGFDGLDLAFQFPRNKPRKVHTKIGMVWKKFKKIFTGNFIVDTEAATHKKQFTEFVDNLYDAYSTANLSLTLTVLPNVNSTWYLDIPNIYRKFDYINLFAFDFLTPERNPEEADYTAPIYFKEGQDRLPHYNIEFQVQHWLDNGCPAHKLNLGIATYARAWKTTTDSGLSGQPVVAETEGPAAAGLQSKTEGLLSWPEVCAKVTLSAGGDYRGAKAPPRKVIDIERKYGNYAFCPADENNEHGLWMSFDDPEFAVIKTQYAKEKGLGGVALFDISYDDFRGLCTGIKYPILLSVENAL